MFSRFYFYLLVAAAEYALRFGVQPLAKLAAKAAWAMAAATARTFLIASSNLVRRAAASRGPVRVAADESLNGEEVSASRPAVQPSVAQAMPSPRDQVQDDLVRPF